MSILKFKNLIKEAVREVLEEQNFSSLHESKKYTQNIPAKKSNNNISIPEGSNNILHDMLNETARNMSGEDISNLMGSNNNNTNNNIVESITQISNSKTLNEEEVVIDGVPDYSEFMKTMNK